MWLEICKYVLFERWCHSTSTYDTWNIGWDNQFSQPKKTKKTSQIHQKSFKNRPLDPPWHPFGATLGTLGKHLGKMYPKDWILVALGRVLGAQDDQFGSNLEAKDPPKSRLERETIDVKRMHVFGIDFSSYRTSFWKGFWLIFLRTNKQKL